MFEVEDWASEEPPFGPGERERHTAITTIQSLSRRWRAPSSIVDLGGALRWTPDLVAPERHALHLSLGGAVPRAFARRLEAARQAGWKLTVAVATPDLDIEALHTLQRLDARLVMVDLDHPDGPLAYEYRSVPDWIALEGISLSPPDFQRLVRARLHDADTEPTNTKGRFFEEALCLFFAQASWLHVEEHSLNNETEEIDLVLSIHATGDLAGLAGGPLAIATAKNEAKPTNSQVVKYLKGQMANRRKRCQLGFLCSSTTISAAAHLEILRGSTKKALIVELDRAALDRLIEHPTSLSDRLAEAVRSAANS